MGLVIPELVLESVIRDGIRNIQDNPQVLSDVFSNLTRAFNQPKYSASEINKIQKIIQDRPLPIVYSFHMVTANIPCISINLSSDLEDTGRASLGDYVTQETTLISDPLELQNLIRVGNFTPTSYNSLSGAIKVSDSVDLSQIYANLLFVDASGLEFPILGGIVDTAGAKQFLIAKQASVNIAGPCLIKSSIDFTTNSIRGNVENVQLLVGIHTRDPLTTKYLYTLIKYILLSRKTSLIDRDFQLATYSGSDFTRNQTYGGDAVFDRFLTVSGVVQHSWVSDPIPVYDNIEVIVQTQPDVYDNAELGIPPDASEQLTK